MYTKYRKTCELVVERAGGKHFFFGLVALQQYFPEGNFPWNPIPIPIRTQSCMEKMQIPVLPDGNYTVVTTVRETNVSCMEPQLRDSLNPIEHFSTMVRRGSKVDLNWAFIIPRGVSLSDS